MNEFQLPFYLEVHQTRSFTIIQCNKVINITIYYFKIWLYDHVNHYYSRVSILLGYGGTLPRAWCCMFWDHCVVSERRAPINQWHHRIPSTEAWSALLWNVHSVTYTG